MKITPVQKRIEQQRIRHQQDKIHREHLEYVRKENQKRIEHPNKGKRIDEYVKELEQEIIRLKAIIEKLSNTEELNPQAVFAFPSPPRIDR